MIIVDGLRHDCILTGEEIGLEGRVVGVVVVSRLGYGFDYNILDSYNIYLE